MRVEIDRNACVGSGWCVNVAAPAFELDDQSKAVYVPTAEVGEDALLDAEDNCPTAAITVTPDPEGDDA